MNSSIEQAATESPHAPEERVHAIAFPWLSTLGALCVAAYLVLTTEPALVQRYALPAFWHEANLRYALLAIFILVLSWDLLRYNRQNNQQKKDVQNLRRQIQDLWQNKKQLQLKAHTYSGHADKLKLFISDKLLNYIEYDEKFLHFKSIAAEVRHNGVISFDKVQTALQKAADGLPEDGDRQQKAAAQDALHAMRYLWDLLDLSTADNLSLHVGNLLCECEEHYYQRMLELPDAEPLPYEPVYAPQRAVWRALGLACQEALPPQSEDGDYTLVDKQWYVALAPVDELLGNENHLVLLAENLLKNAQFFSGKRGYKSPFAPVAVTLRQQDNHARLRVYNRGPHILEEDRHNLFQLGFSTRRARANHGRGLGLYFVNEIVKGYEGRIIVRNVHTPAAQYTVRLELENGEVMTELTEVVVVDGQPQCRTATGELAATREWQLKAPLRSLEVTVSASRAGELEGAEGPNTQRLTDFAHKGKQTRFDPAQPAHPRWQIHYQPKRNDPTLVFEPLDISGVEFEVRLPTAQQRLDSSEFEPHDDIDAEVERLDEHFAMPGEAGR